MIDDLMERLRYLLNLPTLATGEEVLAELDKLRAQVTAAPTDTAGNRPSLSTLLATAINRAETPPLDKFIPRADYDAALARASNAETRVKELETGQRNQAIEAALNAALQAGQICPATVEFYRAGCQREGGLAAFTEFLKTAPPVLGAKPDLDGKKPNAPPTAATLTPEQKTVCTAMGIDPALYAKNLETTAQ